MTHFKPLSGIRSRVVGPRQEIPLPLPRAIGRFPITNKIPLSVANSQLDVEVDWWDEITVDHTLQLQWDDVDIGPRQTITQADVDDPTTMFEFTVPATAMTAEGPHKLVYVDRTALGVNPQFSLPVTVVVDRTAPGGTTMPELIFDRDVIDDGLTESDLVNGQLSAIMPDWFDMEGFDGVTPAIRGEGASDYTLLPNSRVEIDWNQVGQSVNLFFERDDIVAAGDGTVFFGYQLDDQPGNISAFGPGVPIVVLIASAPSGLLAPLVPAFDDGVVSDSDARPLPVDVQIPAYTTPLEGDIITLTWGSQTAIPYTLVAADIIADPVTTFQLTYPLIQLAGSGQIPVSYSVTRSRVTFGPSLVLTVLVDLTIPGEPDPDPTTPINENLGSMIVLSFGGTPNVIPEDEYGLAATGVIPHLTVVDVPPESVFREDDVVTMIWNGVAITPPYVIQITDLNQDLELPIPASVITDPAAGPGLMPVSYTISRELQPGYTPPQFGVALSPVTSVDVRSNLGQPNDGNPLTVNTYVNIGGIRIDGDNVIDKAEARSGAYARCPVIYPNVNAGDALELYFLGYDDFLGNGNPIERSRYEPRDTLNATDITRTYRDILIPQQYWQAVCLGSVKVYYRLINDKGPGTSLTNLILTDQTIGTDPTCLVP